MNASLIGSDVARASSAPGEPLVLQTRGPHGFTWIAAPIALLLVALGVLGVAEVRQQGAVALVTGLASLALGAAIAWSVAYSAWGSVEIARIGETWAVTRRLGAATRVETFPAAQVRSAEVYSPPPYVVVWPGGAGRHVRVELAGRARPVDLAAGLCLDDELLSKLRALFTPTQKASRHDQSP
jgi:hypothetical protein